MSMAAFTARSALRSVLASAFLAAASQVAVPAATQQQAAVKQAPDKPVKQVAPNKPPATFEICRDDDKHPPDAVKEACTTVLATESETDERKLFALIKRAVAETQQVDYDAARADLLKAKMTFDDPLYEKLITNRQKAEVINSLCDVEIGAGNYAAALLLCDEAIRLDDDKTRHYGIRLANYYADRGWLKRRLGDLPGAIADYNQAIQFYLDLKVKEPKITVKPYLFHQRAYALRENGDVANAQSDFTDAIDGYGVQLKSAEPRDLAAIHKRRGDAYYGVGNTTQAIADYNKSLEYNDQYAPAFNSRGEVYFAQGDYQKAQADFGQVIELKANVDQTKTFDTDQVYAAASANRALVYMAKASRLTHFHSAQRYYYTLAQKDLVESVAKDSTKGARDNLKIVKARLEPPAPAPVVTATTSVVSAILPNALIPPEARVAPREVEPILSPPAPSDAAKPPLPLAESKPAAPAPAPELTETPVLSDAAKRRLPRVESKPAAPAPAPELTETPVPSDAAKPPLPRAESKPAAPAPTPELTKAPEPSDAAKPPLPLAESKSAAPAPSPELTETPVPSDVAKPRQPLVESKPTAPAPTPETKPTAVVPLPASLPDLSLSAPPTIHHYALVIGENAYPNLAKKEPDDGQLHFAVNDAKAMENLLTSLGYQVEIRLNAGRNEIWGAVDILKQRILPGDVMVFAYSGHGVSLAGSNLLLPSDIPYLNFRRDASQLRNASIPLTGITEEFKNAGVGLFIGFIDACRDNPLDKNLPGEATVKVRSALGEDDHSLLLHPVQGAFLVFSAAQGQTALDGGGEAGNSLFMSVLTSEIRKNPSGSLFEIAGNVKGEVARKAAKIMDEDTHLPHQQHPAIYDETMGDEPPTLVSRPPSQIVPVAVSVGTPTTVTRSVVGPLVPAHTPLEPGPR
jgi:tetratricopeptide (TPR) repeat protein